MKKIIMGIGLPGSGKTTFLKPFAEENGYVYISPDEIREELTGNAIDHSKNQETWDEVRNRLVQALSENQNIVVDATFYKDFERKAFIDFARENGAEKIQGVFSAVPYEIANERNKSRERVVPEHAMRRIYKHLDNRPPEVSDGFDSVFDLSEFQELKRAETRGGEEGESVVREFKKPR